MTDPWMNTAQAAAYTGLHPVTIRQAAIDGELQSAQPRGRKSRRRYRREWLDAWVSGKRTRRLRSA